MENGLLPKLFINDEDLQWENLEGGVTRKIISYDNDLMMVKVAFEKGAIGALHQHYHSQISNVQEGVFEVEINNQKQVLKQGDGFYIPPNAVHGCVCLEKGILIDVFSPKREDFLK
ncbi:MAG: cupin domain-containing protein [Sediminibacterium sp.]